MAIDDVVHHDRQHKLHLTAAIRSRGGSEEPNQTPGYLEASFELSMDETVYLLG